ncbi:MAG: hypothetical protein IPJ24_04200 [bacterium]|nr:hypothetical protein [bacterium]
MYPVDCEDDSSVVEVKWNVSALREVQAGLVQLAQLLGEHPGKSGYLALVNSRLSEATVLEQLERLAPALRQDVARNLHIVFAGTDPEARRPSELPIRIWEEITRLATTAGSHSFPLPRPSMQSEVLRVLLQQRYAGSGPLTADWLAKTVGCSYRTVAAALHSLGSAVTRTRDRRVELAYFAEEAWRRLLVTASAARTTMRYEDRSGQSRSAEYLERKVRQLERCDLAIGGVFGARHHMPSLDIVSAPRLDICVHAPLSGVELLPVERLDPGLVATSDPQRAVRLAVHYLRRRVSLFENVADGSRVVDPVECLLDLHDARLDVQAQQLLDHLESRRNEVTRYDR